MEARERFVQSHLDAVCDNFDPARHFGRLFDADCLPRISRELGSREYGDKYRRLTSSQRFGLATLSVEKLCNHFSK